MKNSIIAEGVLHVLTHHGGHKTEYEKVSYGSEGQGGRGTQSGNSPGRWAEETSELVVVAGRPDLYFIQRI